MCTNFALIKKDGTAVLANRLHIDESALIYKNNFMPGSTISIVTGGGNDRVVRPAIWWLYLQQTASGLVLTS